MMIVLRAIVIWFVLMVLGIANGITRNAAITPRVGEHAGHIISTVILCLLILLVTLGSIRWMAPGGERNALLIGLFWVVLTVAFEFLAGHYLFGNPWEKLLADYNILRGRIWLLVLITSFVSPWLSQRMRGL